MSSGYAGKVLFVDLDRGRIDQEGLAVELCRDYIGGYGIGLRIIFHRQNAGVNPLGSENMLAFVTGPLTGSPAPTGSRYSVIAKSPLTGFWGEANSGGDFGPYLKFAGYDAVFITGISEKPAYLLIDDGIAELKAADHIWGKDCVEVEEVLHRELGHETRIACIGPAGEKLSLIAAIINDRGRAAARSGMGAVMGSKKLKAIAVRGRQRVQVSDEARVEELRKKYLGSLGGLLYEALRKYGTCVGATSSVVSGEAPVKNWGGEGLLDFPNAESLGGEFVIELQLKRYGCWRCPIACGGLMKEGRRYQYPEGAHKPEYETLASFGSLCLNDNVESIIKMNDICNRFGLDTISAGAILAFAIECYENNIVNKENTGGMELTWGNHEAMVTMTDKIARREGFGDILADGVKRAAAYIGHGSEEFAMHIGGQEVPMHDPRRTAGWGSAYKVDAAPGRHTVGNEDNIKLVSGLQLPQFDSKAYVGRGEAHKVGANWFHIINASGLCTFGCMSMPASALPDFLSAVTGWDYDKDLLSKIGERIANLRQAFSIREGFTLASLNVPGRIIGKPPQQAGPLKGRTVDLQTMSDDYCDAMDWDRLTGKPSRRKLEELDLGDIANAIGV